eukprot:TRINITY_DN14141_c0_g1_i1.p1 TRINITY_DN14141_c0_g1~~TRINITY_DN14141_c0_g1_i1.p1  ORF type:complete len:116 (+),score=6.65 TRINITY_DN14141_c0_g1_i1:105-452(+)
MPYEAGRVRQLLSLTRSRENPCERAQTKQAALFTGRRLWRSLKGLTATKQSTHDLGKADCSTSLLTSITPCDSSRGSANDDSNGAGANDVNETSTGGSSTFKPKQNQSTRRLAWS